MTTAYWFDLDGTLLGYERSFESMVAACIGGDQPAAVHETFRRRLFVAFDDLEPAPFERGFEAVREAHGLGIDPARAAAEYRERELAATRLVHGAEVILEAVGALGPLGILTNGDADLQRAKLHRHGLDEHADAVVISGEVGVRKPDPGIFDAAREQLPADEHVYVGDTYEEDIAGARDAGFEAVHVRHDEGPAMSVDRLASLGLLLPAPADTH